MLKVHVPNTGNFHKIAEEVAELVKTKNKAYGNSFHETAVIFSILYPCGISTEEMPNALFLIRIWDKMKRIATNKDALGESPYKDIIGYALLALERDEKLKKENINAKEKSY